MSENYSYDSIGAANASSSALQAGFVNRVFGWMTGGLALTGAMAWAVYNIEPLYKLVLAACRSEIFGFGKSMSIPIDA